MKKQQETPRAIAERAKKVVTLLRKTYPEAKTSLEHETPLQLLISTILSAQCTDVRVNMVTPALFDRYKTAGDFAEADRGELESYIRSINFYQNKAKNIIASAQAIVERHGGEVPRSMEELTALAGVGRKTANCVLGAGFGIPSGVVVDTHVARLTQRLGLTLETDPVRIERDLNEIVPKRSWIFFSHALILHGRAICTARAPKCPECIFKAFCPSAQL
ncbi:MAG TPA: endonuclease III [Bacteroidota bacterium]|nr:endonuclease III [Bacteroidota bacterium]